MPRNGNGKSILFTEPIIPKLSNPVLESLYGMLLESYKNASSAIPKPEPSHYNWITGKLPPSEIIERSEEMEMYWMIHGKGSSVLVSEMPTKHLFYATRLVYNRLVPFALRLHAREGLIATPNCFQNSMKKTLRILMFNLGKPERMDELDEWMLEELIFIQHNIRKYL